MLKKYIVLLSVFITFIIWLIIYISVASFLFFKYSHDTEITKNILKQKIIKLKNSPNIAQKIEEFIANIIIQIGIWTSDQINNLVLKNFWTNYISIRQNKELIFTNFSTKNCWKTFICKNIPINNYTITLWKKLNYPLQTLYNDLKKFFILSLFIGLLLNIPIYLGIKKLMEPVENNIKFMENFINLAWHELKTPLANIKLSFQILKKLNKLDKNILKDIEKEIHRATNLINSLLNLATTSHKKDSKELNICDIIKEIEKNLNLPKDIKYSKQGECFLIKADPEHIYIFLKNLIANAFKHNIKNGFVKLIIKPKQIEIINSWKKIENTELIFEPFYKSKTSNWYGLWLNLVKKIANLYNRKIKVYSENWINKFTIFFT